MFPPGLSNNTFIDFIISYDILPYFLDSLKLFNSSESTGVCIAAPSLPSKTAREKQRSVTAEEAAQAVADAEKVIKSSARSSPPLRTTMSAPITRGNKPLGWFMGEDIVEKMGASAKADGSKSPDDKKRRRGARRGSKKSTDLMSNQTPSEGSVTSDDLFDDKRSEVSKDDYWYYDVASDGYYYEQNGAKGWRRRMPNSALQKIKEQEMAQLANSGKTPAQNPQVQAAAQAALLQSALFSQPSLKYYDPNSDGFFYEMASVDGWKRRQPVARPSIPRALPGSSYGAALARGQLPRTSIIDDSSASSSVSEDTISTDPFGADAGFFVPENFGVSRPDSLNFSSPDTILPGFNAEKFIQDLSFSGLDHTKMFSTRTPAESWAQRCNNWAVTKDAAQSPEEESIGLLLKGLENIWATPTPVKNP